MELFCEEIVIFYGLICYVCQLKQQNRFCLGICFFLLQISILTVSVLRKRIRAMSRKKVLEEGGVFSVHMEFKSKFRE